MRKLLSFFSTAATFYRSGPKDDSSSSDYSRPYKNTWLTVQLYHNNDPLLNRQSHLFFYSKYVKQNVRLLYIIFKDIKEN